MKKIQSALLATVIGMTAISTQAQLNNTAYNHNLIIGFTSQSGNDLIYDLGADTSLTNGKTWSLGSLVSGYNLNAVNWGVVGTVATNHTSYATYDSSFGTPPPVPSLNAWKPINTAVTTLYGSFPAAGAGQFSTVSASAENSWNAETISAPDGNDYVNENISPNVVGLVSAPFYLQPDDNSTPVQLGTFSLAANGVVTYNIVSTTASAPPPQITSVTRLGNTSTISFTTTNGSFTYSLYYTNATGLTAPVTNWPSSPTTLVGNGSINSLSDTTTATNRFYRIGVH